MKGLRDIRTFITADALLAAILLVWAQLRIHPSIELFIVQFYGDESGRVASWSDYNFAAGVTFAWTYFAVFLALLALGWVGWRSIEKPIGDTPHFAIGLFGASIAMAVMNVGQSVVSIIEKLLNEPSIYESLNLCIFPRWLLCAIFSWAFVTVIATGLLFYFSPKCGKRHKIAYILLWAVGVGLGVFFILSL